MKKIIIETKDKKIELDVKVVDNNTSRKISEKLPIKSRVNLWGDEIYFDAGVDAPTQGLTMDLEVGDIAYWPTGQCLCLFFGRTRLQVPTINLDLQARLW